MDAKEAIGIAKQLVADVFAGELTSPPTLEEIWFDDKKDEWFVTVGLRRPTNHVERNPLLDPMALRSRVVPDLKVVRISNKGGKIPKIIDREVVSV